MKTKYCGKGNEGLNNSALWDKILCLKKASTANEFYLQIMHIV